METLAYSNQVDVSLLLGLLEKSIQISDDLGRNARELISLRILESFLVQGAQSVPVSSGSSPKIRFDPSERCEDVLQRILIETSGSNQKAAELEMSKWDIEPFIVHKRASLATYSLQQLKDVILTGSHSSLASLKEQSGLSVGNQSQHRDLLNENVLLVKRKRSATIKNTEGNSSKGWITSRDGCKIRIKFSKRYKHDVACSKQDLAGKAISLVVNEQSVDTSTTIAQNSERERCSLGKNTRVQGIGLDGHAVDDNSKCTLSRELVVPGEVLPCEKQVPNSDNQQPNNKSDEEKGQEILVEQAKGDKEGFCDRKCTERMEKFVLNIQNRVPNIGEGEENIGISVDSHGCDDNRTGIATKNASFNQLTHSQVSSETNWRKLNVLADMCTTIVESMCSMSKRTSNANNECIRENHATNLDIKLLNEDQVQDHGFENAGDKEGFHELKTTNEHGKNELTSSKGVIEDGKNEFSSNEDVEDSKIESTSSEGVVEDGKNELASTKGVVGDTKSPIEKLDEEQGQDRGFENAGDKEGFHELKTANEEIGKFEQNIQRNVPIVGDTEEDVDISSDSEGFCDERTDIATKRNDFLSSQGTYSQCYLGTNDLRELNVCVKCNQGEKLLVCSSNSCPLVIHECCLDSAASFDTEGRFYCPFCSYSRAISKYMDIKKKASLIRKDFASFIHSGTREEPNKQHHRSYKIKQHHLEQDDGLSKSNELNSKDIPKETNNCQHNRTLEYEQAGPSALSSGEIPSFSGKGVDSTNGAPHTLHTDKEKEKNPEKMSQSWGVRGRHQMAAQAILRSQGENMSCQVLEKNDAGQNQAEITSKKGVLCSPESDLPRELKSSPRAESADDEEISEEENENSGASKYFTRVQKHKRQYLCPAIPQSRRKRVPWTKAEEETLKEGMRRFGNPHDRYIPWKKIMEFGADIYQGNRSTIDLKDKWRNLCKASPKS